MPLPPPLSRADVCKLLGITPNTLRAWVKAGRAPAPLNLGIRRLYWSARSINRALRGKAPPRPDRGRQERGRRGAAVTNATGPAERLLSRFGRALERGDGRAAAGAQARLRALGIYVHCAGLPPRLGELAPPEGAGRECTPPPPAGGPG